MEFQGRFCRTPRREVLLGGLLLAARLLKLAGCRTLYVDGSFVTAKLEPGDFDACWDLAGVDAAQLAPVFLDFSDERAAWKAQFGGELFSAQLPEGGTGRMWLDFFQQARDGRPKGIVALDLENLE